MRVARPVYMKYSANEAPVYGARYWRVAGESAFSATIIV